MIIIFGWMKESEYVKPLIDTYCYHCNNETTWHLCKETEWVTFFDVKTVPFINDFYISCEKCSDLYELKRPFGRKMMKLSTFSEAKRKALHDSLVKGMEKHQLADKTPQQIEYIRVMRKRDLE